MILSWLWQKREHFIIERFQVVNLLSQRIPFEVVAVEKLAEEYRARMQADPMLKGLLERYRVLATRAEIEIEFGPKSHRVKDAPVFMICNNGRKSNKMAAVVAKLGFKNLYTLSGGIRELLDA